MWEPPVKVKIRRAKMIIHYDETKDKPSKEYKDKRIISSPFKKVIELQNEEASNHRSNTKGSFVTKSPFVAKS